MQRIQLHEAADRAAAAALHAGDDDRRAQGALLQRGRRRGAQGRGASVRRHGHVGVKKVVALAPLYDVVGIVVVGGGGSCEVNVENGRTADSAVDPLQ